jgi:mannose-1-phosphate guanylyltransferase
VQALILAGGAGTRLRPLTSTVPKPVVALAGRPFIVYMLDWLRRHGVDDVILSCGFLAEGVERVLGDGARFGVRLRYLHEPQPLGTGGALKYAEALLDERFFMLNGDLLCDIDLTAQLSRHEQTGARATLALIEVKDPSAYGLVRLEEDGSVREFVEKPGPEQIGSNLVNAGAYILQREVLESMAPLGTNISIEREVFPALVGQGLFGYPATGYWLDIGTPARYLRATYDILEGNVATAIDDGMSAARVSLAEGATVDGRVVAPALVGSEVRIARGAIVGGRSVLERAVTVGAGARVVGSVVLEGSSIGARSTITDSIVGPQATIGERCQLTGGVVVGERVSIGPDNVLAAGARIFPGVQLPRGAIRF